jgi:hypothetical protein
VTPSFAFLSDGAVFELLIRSILGAVASFIAIISWTKTRHLYWFFVIAGILASYAGTLYRSFRSFGLFFGPEILVFGSPLGILVSDNLSMICFLVAGIAYIRANR